MRLVAQRSSIEEYGHVVYADDGRVATNPPEDVCVRFGLRVRKLRQARSWTLTYFSVHSGLAKTFVHDVESGKKEPCLRTIQVFAKSFDLTIAQLLSRL